LRTFYISEGKAETKSNLAERHDAENGRNYTVLFAFWMFFQTISCFSCPNDKVERLVKIYLLAFYRTCAFRMAVRLTSVFGSL